MRERPARSSSSAKKWAFGGLLAAACAGGAALFLRRSSVASPDVGPTASQAKAPASRSIATVVYDGGLQNGWQAWGWGPRQLGDGGAARIGFANYGAIVLRHERVSATYGALGFRFLAPESFGEFLDVSLEDKTPEAKSFPHVAVTADREALLEDKWKEVTLPWSDLNPAGAPFDRIVIRAHRGVGSEVVSLDKIVLTTPDAAADGGSAQTGSRRVRMTINCSSPSHRISELIYGLAGDVSVAGSHVGRLGGNPMSRFNWDLNNVWNTGSDWFFENTQISGGLAQWLEGGVAEGWKTALVVPMIGWVAKDTTSVGFPSSTFGKQRKFAPDRPEAGDGAKPDGTPIKPGPPTLTSVPAPPELIERWVARLREIDRARGKRSVHMYILDNEPSLWNGTHRDVHPDPVTYDELLDRTIKYGSAIRRADPEAVIAGPAEWGWTGYFYSAKDKAIGTSLMPDRLLHGGTPLIEWYLRELAEHEKKTGERILDILDVHFYPQSARVFGGDEGVDPETAALRLRSTRALWDPTYRDESWIGEPVRLIPRLKDWVDHTYPGRGISIGEWNFGGERDMSGALAIAEALGRFGQQGLTSAFYWTVPPAGSPGLSAFHAYLNFDGKGGRFLDWSVATDASGGTSLFASRDESGKHLVAVALNMDPLLAADATIALSACGHSTSRDAYVYSRGMRTFTKEGAPRPDNEVLEETIPPYSIKVLDIKLGDPR